MFKSCFISIIGKPNVGKSTLLNFLVGQKVSIVSWHPQTTRDVIRGIWHGDDFQVVFLDTPGFQNGITKLNEYMRAGIKNASTEIDGLIYMIDGSKLMDIDEIKIIKEYSKKYKNFIIVLNKTDLAANELILKNLEMLKDIKKVLAVFPISVHKGNNLEQLKDCIKQILKEGEKYYPDDYVTDKDLRFLVKEIIREKALKYVLEEIPHGLCVDIIKYAIRDDSIVDIESEIILEKDRHKPIVIGKNGDMLKKIMTEARKEIEKLTEEKVNIKVWVKVRSNWQNNQNFLQDIGYKI